MKPLAPAQRTLYEIATDDSRYRGFLRSVGAMYSENRYHRWLMAGAFVLGWVIGWAM